MKLSAKLRTNPALALCLLPALLVAGCANPGPPRPPSLHLPATVSDLAAQRVGDQIRLHWTTPDKTTDGSKIKGVTTAEICRAPESAPASACTPIRRLIVTPGLGEAVDTFSPALSADPQRLIRYQITLLNDREHTAGPSTSAFAAAGSAPPPIDGFRAQSTAKGALLQWSPTDAGDVIEVTRLDTAATRVPPRPPSAQPAATNSKEPAEMRFRTGGPAPGGAPFRSDAGGTLDVTARRGDTYTYTAERVRSVRLVGHTLEIRSAPSPAVNVVMRDTYPPTPPAGLETIAIAQPNAPLAIDLSWTPNTEAALAGYLVYRQELSPTGSAAGAPVRLTPTPIVEPGFHDTAVVPGHTFRYTITAVDSSGNESAPGAPAREDLPLP